MLNTQQPKAYKQEIIDGNLSLPSITNFREEFGDEVYHKCQQFFKALWYAYLKKGNGNSISTIHWMEEVNHPKAFNILLMLLSNAGWITTITQPERNWSETYLNESKLTQYVPLNLLSDIRKHTKVNQYLLQTYDPSFKPKQSYNNLTRKGFANASTVPFKYDIRYLEKYKDDIINLINKGINMTIEKYPYITDNPANFKSVGEEVVNTYIQNPSTYMSGQNRLDPRGRDIARYLNKIGNPIGYKVMRSLLIIPKAYRNNVTTKGIINKYLFIAELNGYKTGTIKGKIEYGRHCYYINKLPEYSLETLPEIIWLQRLYDDLNQVFDVPNNRFKQFMFKLYNDDTRLPCDKITTITMSKAIEKDYEDKQWSVPIEVD